MGTAGGWERHSLTTLGPLCSPQVHTLVGAGAVGRGGGGGGGLDISNLLKPALARGELQCIGATTLDEHRKHIERDAALERCRRRQGCGAGLPAGSGAGRPGELCSTPPACLSIPAHGCLALPPAAPEAQPARLTCPLPPCPCPPPPPPPRRRFQPVFVDEPSEVEALAILEGLQDRYERHHRVVYSSDALEAAVSLSSRYITDRHLPDKAIDLLDEAGSRVRIAAYNARKAGAGRDTAEAAATSYLELEQVVATKAEAVQDLLFEEAALLRQREVELKARLSGVPEAAPVVPVVEAAHIEQVVSAWTGVPVERMCQDDRDRLLTLGGVLQVRGCRRGVHAACRRGGLAGRLASCGPRCAATQPRPSIPAAAPPCVPCRPLPPLPLSRA